MNLTELSKSVHAANEKWWQDPATQQPIKRNKGELLALIHSEISECDDGEDEGLMDDKLPHRKMGEVECVDGIIRILDYAAGFNYDLNRAALLVGVSEFIDLNHLPECAMTFDIVANLERRGIALIHSKVSKVLEHERKSRFNEVPEALVSCIIHISVYAVRKGYDLQGAFDEKMAYNAQRADHKHEARLIAGGKQF